MKSRIQKIVFLAVGMLCGVAISASAQEAGMSDTEISTNREITDSDKAAFTPGEDTRYIPRASGIYAPTDSVTLQIHDFPMQRAAQKPAEKTAEKQQSKPKDDSILTYNFLYYIIQKYKLQDIID